MIWNPERVLKYGSLSPDTEQSPYGNPSVYMYNVACVFGRSLESLLRETPTPEQVKTATEYRRQALLFLKAAIEMRNGFNDPHLLETDADLNSLRDLPEFKELSGKIKDSE